MIDLETRIMNRLQEKKNGQTLEQLQEFLKERRASFILTALYRLRCDGSVKG